LPAILYMHGGGWILGSWITHDLLTRRLALGANAAVVFVEYSRAPEAKYPVQIEQCYAAAQWITGQGAGDGFDITRIAVAGDSAGGNMSTVLALMAKQRGGVQFVHQSLYYPMTDANAEDSESLRRFKNGPYGSADGLACFWNSYLTAEESRSDILVSPLQATLADLEGLPPALVIVDENDLLRDQGEAYADKLRDAGFRLRPCVSTARSTTSCASMRYVSPNRLARRSVSRSLHYGELSARSSGQGATNHGQMPAGRITEIRRCPLPAAIVGVVTSLRTRTAIGDVPRESWEEE
jgi:alpha/beta hydrolase fold